MDEARRRALIAVAGAAGFGPALFGEALAQRPGRPSGAESDPVLRAQFASATPEQLASSVPVNCKLPPFNCRGDTRYDAAAGIFEPGADDTAGMKAFFDYCIRTGARGYIPAGKYLIDWGALAFDNGHTDSAWPDIATAGFDNVFFIGRGDADRPMISITNGTATGSDDRVWHGGALGGLTVVQARGSGYRNRHALLLAGVQQIQFGYIVGLYNDGHVLFCPRRTVRLGPDAHNPDPYHVYSCRFSGIFGLFNTGWTIRNENAVGLNHCNFGNVRAASNGGGFYGWGGNNIIETWSSGSTGGWALHDGSDVALDHGVPNGLHILAMMEVDDPRQGFFIGRAKHCRFQARIIHRNNFQGRFGGATASAEGYWPRDTLRFGGPLTDAYDHHITLYHRVDGPDPRRDARRGGPNIAVDFADLRQPLRTSEISVFMQDNLGYGFAESDYVRGVNAAGPPECRITLGGKTIYDRLPRSLFAASCGGDLAIGNQNYPAPPSILPFDSVRWDRGGDAVLDPERRCHGFRANRDGECRFRIGIRIDAPAGTRFRLGILERAGADTRFTGASQDLFQTAAAPQTHIFQIVMRVTRGSVYFPCGDQNSGRPSLNAVGLLRNEMDLIWQAEMVE